ncbi:MAG: polysaccharide biosynthesis protein [Lachnospiraceae bacterium]|nr:polysaccharide biosynthesis protein [Lachnospiraceae bacterium]MBR6486502.1 polysaccharide biosynthesis protein [Lachnospiraceae bacterium]
MYNNEGKRSNFIVQGGILAITGVISRIIGLVYRIPLQKKIGDSGMGYYSAAFQIYSIMLIISSYSLPTAVSKLVAMRIAKGQYRNARKILHGAMLFALITGGAACLIVLAGADVMASNIMNLPKSAIALRILAPTLLIVAVMGVIRGYFQGLGTMMPTAFSQLFEQVVNAVISVIAAIYLFEYGTMVSALLKDSAYSAAYGAAGGTLGTCAGALAGLIMLTIMFIFHNREMKKDVFNDNTAKSDSFPKIIRILIITILPVILSSTIYNISDVLDQGVFGSVMAKRGMGEHDIASYWGIFSTKYKVIINVPVALANALCSSIMPSLTSCVEQGKFKLARHKVRLGMRFVMIIAFPCAMGLSVLGKPILSMLFTGEIEIPAMLLRIGSATVILYSMSTLSNGVLQGINKLNIPVRNAAIALAIHIGILYVCIGVLDLKLYGVVIALIVFALIICVLNWISIGRYLSYRQEIRKTFIIPFAASAIMGLVIFISYILIGKAASDAVSTIVSIFIGACVYFVALLLLKGVNEAEIRSFPGGDILAGIALTLKLLR